jgi:hypothetical protein
MFAQIVDGTPKWVFGLFFVLLAFGWMQSRTREASKTRVLILPIIMIFLSIGGMLSSFHGHLPSVLAWALGFAVAAVFNHMIGAPAGVRYNAETRRFHLPGSWVPLVLMMAIYFAKYVDGATTALRPDIQSSIGFAVALSGVFGFLSGMFFGRFLRIWSSSLQPVTRSNLESAA